LYRHASRVVAVSDGIGRRLRERGVPGEKIGVVPNGVDLRRLSSVSGERVRSELNLQGKFVLGYVGTHGMAQGLETVLDAARSLGSGDTHFLFVGEGARRDALIAYADGLALQNVTFVGLVPLETAAEYIAACDAILIPLKRTDQIEITIPGKIFEAAAVGRPMIVSATGASADLIQRYGAGIVVAPEEPHALVHAASRLRNDPILQAKLREGALRMAQDFDRERFARQMLEQIRLAVAGQQKS
jgi:hypothetical protein